MMLQDLRRMIPKVRSSLVDTRHISVTKVRPQRGLMELTQPRQLVKTKTKNTGLPTFMLGDTPGGTINWVYTTK